MKTMKIAFSVVCLAFAGCGESTDPQGAANSDPRANAVQRPSDDPSKTLSDKTKEMGQNAWQSTKEAADSVAEKSKDYYEATKEKTSHVVETAKQKSSELYRSAKETGSSMVDATQQTAGELYEAGRQKTKALVEAGKEQVGMQDGEATPTPADVVERAPAVPDAASTPD